MKYIINLFPEKEKDLSEKLVYFGMHYLRYILVITQFVAICVFFFRFKVDQEIVDLKDTLSQKSSIVESTSLLMGRIEEIDKKMKTIESVLADQETFKDRYTYVITKLPPEIRIESLSISDEGIDIQGVSEQADSIKVFYDDLEKGNRFGVTNLSAIEKKDNVFSFKLRLDDFR